MRSPSLKVTQDDLSSCADDSSIVGVGALRTGSSHILKFVYDNNDTEIVCLDERGIQHLVAVLKALVPSHVAIAAVGISVAVPGGDVHAMSPKQ
jgi:hypothetical protein